MGRGIRGRCERRQEAERKLSRGTWRCRAAQEAKHDKLRDDWNVNAYLRRTASHYAGLRIRHDASGR